jgi:cell division protein FtsB
MTLAEVRLLAKLEAENLQLKHANAALRARVKELEDEREAVADVIRARTQR